MKTELKSGEIYTVNHSRKGTFRILIESQDETWAHGIIVNGTAVAFLDYNRKFVGDDITIRKSLCRFIA